MSDNTNTEIAPATAEQEKAAIAGHAAKMPWKEILETTGLTSQQADKAIKTNRAKKRCRALGIQKMPAVALFWLGAPGVDREHDVVFQAIAEAVRDLELTQAETKALTDAVEGARSDEAAVALVAEGTWKQARETTKKTTAEKVAAQLSKLSDDEFAAVRAQLAGKRDEIIAAMMADDESGEDEAEAESSDEQ